MAHSCANCVMWSLPLGADMGTCEAHSEGEGTPPTFKPGMGLRTADGAWQTTGDSFCDYQVPIPPPGPPCRKCGAPTIQGFGLMGGGYGAYEACEAFDCGHVEKWQEYEGGEA